MKIYLDTEFIEYPNTIELISIGMVKENNGGEYYAISNEFHPARASDWVQKNIIDKLEPEIEIKSIKQIKQEIIDFVGNEKPEFYGYFCDYDWVVFCWIFGKMIELPENFPKYCLDLKQEMFMLNLDKEWKRKNCPDPEGEHNALIDARWNRQLHSMINIYNRFS